MVTFEKRFSEMIFETQWLGDNDRLLYMQQDEIIMEYVIGFRRTACDGKDMAPGTAINDRRFPDRVWLR
jgi:hypothetical protein